MRSRNVKPADNALVRHRTREVGYADGFAGRPARHADPEYQRSWRRGRERRAELAAAGELPADA